MNVLITRSEEQAKEFANQLHSLHHKTFFFPTIEIIELNDWKEVDIAIQQIDNYSNIIFTSTNGVKFFFERFQNFFPLEKLSKKTFHAVGNKTQEAISKFNIPVSNLPDKFDSKELVKKILGESNNDTNHFLFPHGNMTDKTIENAFREKNISLDSICVYQTIKPKIDSTLKKEIELQFSNNDIDVITFFSPSSVKNFIEEYPTMNNTSVAIAVIGNTTKTACEKIGFNANQIQFIENLFPQSVISHL